MTSLVVEGGVVSWGPGPYATAEQADAYASARGWSDWAAASAERRLAAILDASTYIQIAYKPPIAATDAVDFLVTNATIEAARLSLSAPLLGGVTAGEPQLIRKKIGLIEKEWAKASANEGAIARLAMVEAYLRGTGATRIGAGVNVKLLKS